MYNVNVKNTFGVGSQALAISQYGSRAGLYACGFYGYQDTLYANQGTQVYLRGYIEVRRGSTTKLFYSECCREQQTSSLEAEASPISVEIRSQ